MADERLRGAWDRYWFSEGSLVRLAVLRIVLMLTTIYCMLGFRPALFQHARESAVTYLHRKWTPIYIFEVLGIEPMGPTTVMVVYVALWVTAIFGILGIASRFSCAAAAVLLFYWIGSSYSFGKPHHEYTVLMIAVCSLPLGPVGARLSVDAWLRRKRTGAPPPETADFALVPIRMTQITAALAYFFAGASKLVIAGPEWANGYTLQGIMLGFQAPWTEFMTKSVFFCQISSIFTLAVQASFPVALVWRRSRWFYVPAAISFHLMSWKTMDTGIYMGLWITLVAFLHTERIPAWVRARTTSGPAALRLAWSLFVAVPLLFIASALVQRVGTAF